MYYWLLHTQRLRHSLAHRHRSHTLTNSSVLGYFTAAPASNSRSTQKVQHFLGQEMLMSTCGSELQKQGHTHHSAAGNTNTRMISTKRKAEGHSRPAGKPRSMKSSGRSRTDSERDSGFSDVGSVSALDIADLEDSPRAVVGSSSGAQPSQLAVVGGSYSNLSPVIIMNNVLLKQPETPPALKPWGFSPAVEVVQPVVQQPQVVFLQPVVSRSKEATSKHRRPKKYLPILKSYPKIAPHPGSGHCSSGRSTTSSSSSSGYSSSSSSSGKSGISRHCERSHRRHKHQQRSPSVCSSSSSSTASLPPASGAVPPLLLRRLAAPLTDSSSSSSPSSERPSPAVSRSGLSPSQCLNPLYCLEDPEETLPLPDAAPCIGAAAEQHGSDSSGCTDGEPDAKRKRFSNTYNILSKSGLLDITLRTKELLRQNRRAQTELDRLKELTALFLKAMQSGDSSVFVRLQGSLQEEDREKEKGVQLQTTD